LREKQENRRGNFTARVSLGLLVQLEPRLETRQKIFACRRASFSSGHPSRGDPPPVVRARGTQSRAAPPTKLLPYRG